MTVDHTNLGVDLRDLTVNTTSAKNRDRPAVGDYVTDQDGRNEENCGWVERVG
jgi:hypothetical protein